MSKAVSMVMSKVRYLLAGLVLLVAGLAWSADNPVPQDSDQEVAQQPDNAAGQDNSADADLVLDEDGAAAADEDEDSPERFIPTEEISQDLGVSFPVDI